MQRSDGIIPLDLQDLVRIVRLWDPAKQRIATASMTYYAAHVERNAPLTSRLKQFLTNADAPNDVMPRATS